MHYKTPRINLAIEPLERFLEAITALGWKVEHAQKSTVDLTRENLPASPTVVCLEPCR